MRLNHRLRRGATIVEFAVVGPLVFLLLIGLLVGGLGIFRYQEVAYTAREASRWASVHGSDYAQETGKSAATAADVYNQAIAPKATSLQLNQLSYSVSWNTNNSPYHTSIVNGQSVKTTNTVTVTVSYHWIPEAFLGGMNLSSTSVSVMSY
jgi:Flp pilus assembly protein TadG